MMTPFKVLASYNNLQYQSDFIHVVTFVAVSECCQSPILNNMVITISGACEGHMICSVQVPYDRFANI